MCMTQTLCNRASKFPQFGMDACDEFILFFDREVPERSDSV